MIEQGRVTPPPHIKTSFDFTSRVWRYGPLIIWAVLIFIGSSNLLSASNTSNYLVRPLQWLFPGAGAGTLAVIHFILRKAGHFTEYAILALLAARAFRTSSRELLREGWFWVSLVLIALYALSDEYHQSFISTRTASIYDSLIDTAGGLTALIVVWLFERRRSARGRDGITANAEA
jgi:VanZ family protein